MAEETKKISFGFSKLKKQTNLVKPVEIIQPEVEYVDSFDGTKGKFSYKGNVRLDEPIKKELIIPLVGTKTALDVIRSKLEENKKGKQDKEECNKTKPGKASDTNGTIKPAGAGERGKEETKDEVNANKEMSIDDLAAREIINDLQNSIVQEKVLNTMVIKQPSKTFKTGDETEAPIDYENIPVNDFGLAMLRGMGWTPETGIGKEQRVVQVVAPKLRPKGLGLGADKVILQKAANDSDLAITIKGYVKFINGAHKGSYGQVESMDEDNGRVIVKLALGGSVSVSEMLLQAVTKKDYEKNSKVLNPMKYERYKGADREIEREEKSLAGKSSHSKKSVEDNRHRKEKYDRRDSRDNVKTSEEDRRKGDSSSSSSEERKSDRKKNKKRRKDDSPNRKHKKSKRKKKKKRRQYSSEDESDSSIDVRHDRGDSRHRSYHKSKNGSHR